jgi:hypothetical protein
MTDGRSWREFYDPCIQWRVGDLPFLEEIRADPAKIVCSLPDQVDRFQSYFANIFVDENGGEGKPYEGWTEAAYDRLGVLLCDIKRARASDSRAAIDVGGEWRPALQMVCNAYIDEIESLRERGEADDMVCVAA